MAKNNGAAPWDRQPGESARAYKAFEAYRDMGAERSHVKVSQVLGKSSALISRWGRAWGWSERVLAWDNELAEAASHQARKEAEEMRKRHIEAARYFQARALSGLGEVGDDQITARDAATLLKTGVDVERMARGEATERTESAVDSTVSIQNPYADLTTDELRKLAAATEDAADDGH